MPDVTILQVVPRLETGGSEQSTIEIAEALTRAGAKALVATEGGRLATALREAGGEIIPLPMASKNPLTILANVRHLTRIVEERNVTLLHARSRAPAWSAYLAARRTLFEVPQQGRRVLIDTEEDARDVVGELVRDLELARPYPVRPAPLETTVHEDASGPRVLFVINPGKRRLDATIEVPAPTTLEDLLSGERFEGRESVTVPMGGWSCRMMAIEGAAQRRSESGTAVAS